MGASSLPPPSTTRTPAKPTTGPHAGSSPWCDAAKIGELQGIEPRGIYPGYATRLRKANCKAASRRNPYVLQLADHRADPGCQSRPRRARPQACGETWQDTRAEHALAVVPDELDKIAALAAEHEQVPAMRIALQDFLHPKRRER